MSLSAVDPGSAQQQSPTRVNMGEDRAIMTRRILDRATTTGWLIVAALVGACTVQLVAPYDEVIDDGLMTFNQDFLQFMAGIKQNVPSESASYASNVDFYNRQDAALGTLVQRARASDPGGSCSSSALTLDTLQSVDSIALSKGVQTGPAPSGSCTAILLTYIQDQLTETACFHQAIYGQTSTSCEALGFTAADAQSLATTPQATKQTLLGQVESAVTTSVTAAMTFELAKKQGTN
jgi:hypothetical protein